MPTQRSPPLTCTSKVPVHCSAWRPTDMFGGFHCGKVPFFGDMMGIIGALGYTPMDFVLPQVCACPWYACPVACSCPGRPVSHCMSVLVSILLGTSTNSNIEVLMWCAPVLRCSSSGSRRTTSRAGSECPCLLSCSQPICNLPSCILHAGSRLPGLLTGDACIPAAVQADGGPAHRLYLHDCRRHGAHRRRPADCA